MVWETTACTHSPDEYGIRLWQVWDKMTKVTPRTEVEIEDAALHRRRLAQITTNLSYPP